MKKIALVAIATLSCLTVSGQSKLTEHLPFVLLIDNEVPVYSDTNGIFLIKDSLGTTKDSVTFDYEVGELKMTKLAYDKLFRVNPVFNIFIRFSHLSLKADTTYIYETQIPNKYINWEYPHGFMNKWYFIIKIFNKFNDESRAKYYFKKNEDYIMLITIPGMGNVIPLLKKG